MGFKKGQGLDGKVWTNTINRFKEKKGNGEAYITNDGTIIFKNSNKVKLLDKNNSNKLIILPFIFKNSNSKEKSKKKIILN